MMADLVLELDKHLFAEFCGGTEGFTKNDDDIKYD